MSIRTRRSFGLALSDVVAAAAALTLVASVAPVGLQRMRKQVGRTLCENNLRVSNQAFNIYGADFRGVWIAPWDTNAPWDCAYQWPYTMLFYVTGHPITDGQPLRALDGSGWWTSNGRQAIGGSYAAEFADSPEQGSQLQCPELVAKGWEWNRTWYNVTSYSYAIMNRQGADGKWRDCIYHYPVPDFMTHPSTTLNLHDMSIIPSEGGPNVWSADLCLGSDPHDGESNFVFCDGHVESMSFAETNERMWQDRWTAESDPSADQ